MTAIDWLNLTKSPQKAEFYQYDVYFREALADLREITGGACDDVVRRSALMIVRPEGMLSGKLTPVLRFLGDHGFQTVAAETVRFDPMLTRELWRYQHTMASLDRLAVVDQMLSVGPALVLLLRRDDVTELPATVRLSALKGASDPAARPPGTLRERLSQPNRLFALVHCADEPADLVRELGILLDAATRRSAIRALADGRLTDVGASRLAEEVRRAEGPVRDIDAPAALERLVKQVTAAGPPGRRAAEMLSAVHDGGRIPWRVFLRELSALGVEADLWDLALVGSSWIEYDEPGTVKLLGGPDMGSWRQASG